MSQYAYVTFNKSDHEFSVVMFDTKAEAVAALIKFAVESAQFLQGLSFVNEEYASSVAKVG